MRFSTSLVAGALASLAYAQTHTECNPMEKDCPNNPAMSAEFSTDFKAGAASVKGWKQTAGSLAYNNEGAQFTINKKGDAPTIQSETYLFFGYVEVKCKASAGQGIISSIVLQSEDLDEVDWEFIGTTKTNVQMNYFGKGNTTTYDRMIEGAVSNPQQEFHTYALNWTSESLVWLIDGKAVRTLKYADAVGGKNFPQTPMTVRIGIWAGGDPDNAQGVIEWAGGKTDYSKAPFTMTVESVKVTNYSPGTEYKWTDKTGSFKSIEVVGAGNKEGNPANSAVLSTASVSATGGGLGSQVNIPTNTVSGEFHEQPTGTKTPCSEGESKPTTTDIPVPSSTALPTGSNPETPCSCGVATVTVTGAPPPPPAPTTLISSSAAPVSSAPPVISSAPVSSAPPYSITSVGIVTDTNPAPSVPKPTIPTPSIPVSLNGTTTAPTVSLFTGAAAPTKFPAAVLGLAAGMAMFVV